MPIPQSVIEQLNEKADLVAIIKRHTDLKPNGREFKGCCPFHGEKTPSFFVNPDSNLYYCFGCGAKGNAISFLVDYERQSFMEALKTLSDQTGIELPKDESEKQRYQRLSPTPTTKNTNNTGINTSAPTQNQPTTNNQSTPNIQSQTVNEFETLLDGSLHGLLSAVAYFYQNCLKHNDIAYRYLLNRGLTPQTIEFFGLGYAPSDWQHLEKTFPNDLEGLKILGLIRTSQKGKAFNLFRDRVIFPIRDKQGRIVGFAGRALDDETLPKYINSSDSVVFQKNHILYGYYESRLQKAEHWLVVEGYLDVIALYQAGIFGAVAPMGTAINAGQISQLLKFNDELTLCFDGDGAGQKASMRALEVAMPVLTDGKSLKFLTLSDNHDPDTYIKAHGKEVMQNAIHNALPMSEYLYHLMANRYELSRPEQKAAAMRDVRALTDKLPKGSFRAWLNGDFFNRLQQRVHHRPQHSPTNYHTKQLSPSQQLALCFLYQPTLATHIRFEQPLHHDDPLQQFYIQTNLLNCHLPFEKRLADFNLLTPPLPTWDDFCYDTHWETDPNGIPVAHKQLNVLGNVIVLIQNALPTLKPLQDANLAAATHSQLCNAQALFLFGAMGSNAPAFSLLTHWHAFVDDLGRQMGNMDNLVLLFNELLYQLTTIYIRTSPHYTNHLLSVQLQKKRLSLLEHWLKQHTLQLEQRL